MNKILICLGMEMQSKSFKLLIFLLFIFIGCKTETYFSNFLTGISNKNQALLVSSFNEEITIETGPLTLGHFSKNDEYGGFNSKKGYLYALFFDSSKWSELSGKGNQFRESLYDCLKNNPQMKTGKENKFGATVERSLYIGCNVESKTLKFDCVSEICKLSSIWLNEEFVE
ncbi:Uncharacterized protein XB16_1949 [Leptospira santarosai]|uniref:Lipoprotein n=2 Tax=Leptospira santarosai TaxID=28183 RepID=A0A2P1QTP5_9LEPT|nr:hypothetical protein [Leptospira santarosai]AVQ12276.1 Uncharacterized protein XB16_1949 [Leptospira santarosai]